MLKLLALLSLSLPLAEAAHAEAPAALTVVKVQSAGSGCPAGHALTATTNGVEAVSIDIPAVKAVLTGAKTMAREACNVTLELAFDAGWQVAATEMSVDTDAAVATGAQGEVAFDAHFQGQAANASGKVGQSGTAPRASAVITLTPPDVWSPCGATATVVGRLALKLQATRGGSPSQLTTLSPAVVKLAWRRCGPTTLTTPKPSRR